MTPPATEPRAEPTTRLTGSISPETVPTAPPTSPVVTRVPAAPSAFLPDCRQVPASSFQHWHCWLPPVDDFAP